MTTESWVLIGCAVWLWRAISTPTKQSVLSVPQSARLAFLWLTALTAKQTTSYELITSATLNVRWDTTKTLSTTHAVSVLTTVWLVTVKENVSLATLTQTSESWKTLGASPKQDTFKITQQFVQPVQPPARLVRTAVTATNANLRTTSTLYSISASLRVLQDTTPTLSPLSVLSVPTTATPATAKRTASLATQLLTIEKSVPAKGVFLSRATTKATSQYLWSVTPTALPVFQR